MADPASFLADPVSFTPDAPTPQSFVADAPVPQQPGVLSQLWEGGNRPMAHIPRVAQIAPYVERLMPSLATNKTYQTGKPIIAGVLDRLAQDAEGFTSPLAVSLMTAGATPGIVGQVVRAALPVYFGGKAITQDLPQTAQAAGTVYGTPGSTPEQKAGALTGMVTPAVMAAGGIGAALPVRGVPTPVRVNDIPSSAFAPPADMAKPTIPVDFAKAGFQPQSPAELPPTPVTPPQPSITPQSFIPDETLQAKPQIPGPPSGQTTPDIQIPQPGEAVRPVQPEGQQPQPGQEGQGLAVPAVPAASEPPLQTPAEPQSAEPLQQALTPAEQANAQRELQEAHAEPGGPTGIAQRVREKVAATGKEELPPSGEGISAADSVERGDSLLTADPTAADRAMTAFEKDPAKAISAEGVAVARARLRQLAQAANRAEETHGINSPEYEAAFRARSDWSARVKKMQTEWHASGMAQQGEQDIDTGTFTGLRSAYVEANPGKDFTPKQAETAKEVATGVKAATEVAETAKEELNKTLKKTSKDSPVWNKVKEYLEKGDDGFDDIRHKVASDLGMRVEDVTKELTKNKETKRLADDVWRKQEALRRFQSQAKRWLKATSLPGYQRVLATIPRTLFAAKVGFHGTVALGTHAPMVAFQPPFWKTYIENFGKMYRMVGSPKYYEMQVQDLTRRQNYTTARRAGLVNDPTSYEDYNSPTVSQYFGRLSGMGNRGYSVLKILRQDMFDQNWNKLPKTLQTPEMASAIADGVNHSTGVTKWAPPQQANVALFAPRLEVSRAAWLARDPIRAADTFLRWGESTEAEKHFAIQQVKEKAWVVGTLGALLAANQGMLSATSSDQKINFTDPMKGDFLNFKAAGMKASYGNPMLTMARLPLRLYEIRASDGGKLKNLVHPDEDTYKVLGEYLRSQASPFAGVIADQLFKADWQNRPLPNSERPVPKRLVAQGIGPYTWTEYLTRQALPIPAEEAAREVWRHMGMNEEQIKGARVAMAAASIAGSALTGGRLGEDTQSVSPMDKQRQQVAQKMFPGKDIASDLKARADVEEAIKREQPKAMEHKYADALPENVQKYLKNEKVAVPTTVEEVTINRQRVPLNDAEQAYYDKLIVDRYTRYFNAVTQQAEFRNSSRYDKQRQVDFETAGLRKDAREQLKGAIQDKKVPPL